VGSSIARTFSFDGRSLRPVCIEVEVHGGSPAFSVVGLPDGAIVETRERLREALASSGFQFHGRRVLVKVTPTGKTSFANRFDLPIATALLVASGQLSWDALERLAIVGELAPDGSTRPVSALRFTARAALDIGADALLIPAEQMEEMLVVSAPGLDLVPVERIGDLPGLAAERPPSVAEVNHCVVTGTLRAEPMAARNSRGDRVTLLRLDFLVQDPDEPQRLWAKATCEVEVPDELARRFDVRKLQAGAPVLAAGQLSEREIILDGTAVRRNVIVASLVKAGPSFYQWEQP
jgi:hypothetical protein